MYEDIDVLNRYGFDIVSEKGNNELEIVPEEADIVREMFRMYLSGEGANTAVVISTNRAQNRHSPCLIFSIPRP